MRLLHSTYSELISDEWDFISFRLGSFAAPFLYLDKNKVPILASTAIILGAVIIIGSIIGIVMLSISFCFEWSGYWAICFLYGILIHVFVIESVYMVTRYIIVQMASMVKKPKLRLKK